MGSGYHPAARHPNQNGFPDLENETVSEIERRCIIDHAVQRFPSDRLPGRNRQTDVFRRTRRFNSEFDRVSGLQIPSLQDLC